MNNASSVLLDHLHPDHLRNSEATMTGPRYRSNMLTEFLSAIRNAGLEAPDVIVDDGHLHRFASNANRHDKAGWYVFHSDGIPAGAFGDWRTGVSESWRADLGRPLSSAEECAHRVKIDAMRRLREEEELRGHADAATQASAIWEAAETAGDEHPYLQAKSVKAHGLRIYRGDLTIAGMVCDGALIVPMKIGEALHSLQFIASNGEKRFLPGGRIKGTHYSIGASEEALKRSGVLCIAEGYATAASIHEATGYGIFAAFNAGNLEPVALTMVLLRDKYPQVRFLVCSDDDAWTCESWPNKSDGRGERDHSPLGRPRLRGTPTRRSYRLQRSMPKPGRGGSQAMLREWFDASATGATCSSARY